MNCISGFTKSLLEIDDQSREKEIRNTQQFLSSFGCKVSHPTASLLNGGYRIVVGCVSPMSLIEYFPTYLVNSCEKLSSSRLMNLVKCKTEDVAKGVMSKVESSFIFKKREQESLQPSTDVILSIIGRNLPENEDRRTITRVSRICHDQVNLNMVRKNAKDFYFKEAYKYRRISYHILKERARFCMYKSIPVLTATGFFIVGVFNYVKMNQAKIVMDLPREVCHYDRDGIMDCYIPDPNDLVPTWVHESLKNELISNLSFISMVFGFFYMIATIQNAVDQFRRLDIDQIKKQKLSYPQALINDEILKNYLCFDTTVTPHVQKVPLIPVVDKNGDIFDYVDLVLTGSSQKDDCRLEIKAFKGIQKRLADLKKQNLPGLENVLVFNFKQ